MFTAERIITACILKLSINPLSAPYESDSNLSTFPHERCNIIWYAWYTLGKSISQTIWHNAYDSHLASFVIYVVMLRDKTTGWTGLSCLCLLTAYEELVEHFFPSSPTQWHCFWTFLLLFSQWGSSHPRSWLAVRSQEALFHSHDHSGLRVVCMLPTLPSYRSPHAYPAPEPRVTSCTPCSSTISVLSWQQPAAHAQHIPQPNILVCSSWCLWRLVGDVNLVTKLHHCPPLLRTTSKKR